MKLQLAMFGALMMLASPAAADPSKFAHGPLITGFGAVAKVDADLPLPPNLDYKIRFDVKSGSAGKVSTGLDAVARLMNMLAASGVPASKINPAVVLHNAGVWDVTTDAAYAQHHGGGTNPNGELVRQLIAKGVPIYICGQTAAWSDLTKSDFIPGVKVALSAMNAHAILHHQGYLLNPF